MGLNPKKRTRRRVRIVSRRRRHSYSPIERLFTIVEDKCYRARYASKTFKDYRNKLKSIVSDDEFWTGLEEIGKAVKKLKVSLDDF